MANRKMTKGQTMMYKTLHRKLKIEQHKPNKNQGGELSCFRMCMPFSKNRLHISQDKLRSVFVCPVLPVSLDCPFLIAPSVFSNV